MKFKAFTLAEVLITLGIIGIVATLTIPSIISAYRKRVTETKLKQTYSILSTALSAGETEYGVPFGYSYLTAYGLNNSNGNNYLYQDFIKPYINSEHVYEYTYTLFSAGGEGPFFSNTTNWAPIHSGKAFTLANGVTVFIYNGQIYIITDAMSFNKKKPLKIVAGKNYFSFGPAIGVCSGLCAGYFTIPHILAPFVTCEMPSWANAGYVCRGRYSYEQIKDKCLNDPNMSSRTLYCTQMYLENNFTFPKDYPVQF